MQLPIGMFGVAVGTIALQRAADSASEAVLAVALEGVRETLRRGLRLVTFYSLPTAVLGTLSFLSVASSRLDPS